MTKNSNGIARRKGRQCSEKGLPSTLCSCAHELTSVSLRRAGRVCEEESAREQQAPRYTCTLLTTFHQFYFILFYFISLLHLLSLSACHSPRLAFRIQISSKFPIFASQSAICAPSSRSAERQVDGPSSAQWPLSMSVCGAQLAPNRAAKYQSGHILPVAPPGDIGSGQTMPLSDRAHCLSSGQALFSLLIGVSVAVPSRARRSPSTSVTGGRQTIRKWTLELWPLSVSLASSSVSSLAATIKRPTSGAEQAAQGRRSV